MSAAMKAARAAYTPFVCEGFARGYTLEQLRGQVAALLVITSNLSRVQAHAVARVVI